MANNMKDHQDTRTVDAFSPPAPKPFTDIRNQRPSTAEQKALPCLRLKDLCNKPPQSIIDGGVSAVRAWKSVQADCRKVLVKATSTVPQLESAISRMGAFK